MKESKILIDKYAIDVDGVLLNFYLKALQKANKPFENTSIWDLKWIREEFKKGTYSDSGFWEDLPLLSDPQDLPRAPVAYVTVIDPKHKKAREENLARLGFPKAPVICAFDKVPVLRELKVNHFIDDRPENVRKINRMKNVTCIQFVPYYWRGELFDSHITNLKQLYVL